MAEETTDNNGSSTIKSDADDGTGRIWRGLKALLFKGDSEPSLREQLEEAIDDHEDDIVQETPDDGDLTKLEREMLRNLLHFSDHTVDDVAVPRADIIAISETAPFSEVIETFSEHGHSRIPVFKDNLDNIIGMIHIKDVFAIQAKQSKKPDNWTDLMRQPRFVPESMGVLDLLAEMRATRIHLAIILDEYSGTEGLVTIEDLVEEIVGEIEDEHDDEPTELLTPLEGGAWDADARTELEDVGEKIDLKLADVEEDIDTLGGLAFVLAGRVPQTGDILQHDSGWKLEILAGDKRHVTKLRLHPPS